MRLSLAPDQQFSRSYSMLMEDDIEKKDEEEVNLLEQRRTSLYDNIRSWVGRWAGRRAAGDIKTNSAQLG